MFEHAGRLHPICCVAPLGAEVMNRFIDADKTANEDDRYWFRAFIFVENLTTCYEKQKNNERIPDPGFPNSPFIDKTPQECHELLNELRITTKSDINPNEFIVMDRRSQDDDSVIVVDVQEDCIKYFRASFDMAVPMRHCWISGRDSIEDIEKAKRQWDEFMRSWDGNKDRVPDTVE